MHPSTRTLLAEVHAAIAVGNRALRAQLEILSRERNRA